MLTTPSPGKRWLGAMIDMSDGAQAGLRRLPRRQVTAVSAALAGVEGRDSALQLGIAPGAVPSNGRVPAAELFAALPAVDDGRKEPRSGDM